MRVLRSCPAPAGAALQSIIETNNELRAALADGHPADKVVESWDFLQVNAAMYINSDVPGLAQANQPPSKPLRCAARCMHAFKIDFSTPTRFPSTSFGVQHPSSVQEPRLRPVIAQEHVDPRTPVRAW